jgi:hypothetical protein
VNIILIISGILITIFLIAVINTEIQHRQIYRFYRVYTPNGLKLVRELERLLTDNKTLPFFGYLDLYQKMFNKKISTYDEFQKEIGIENYEDEPEDSLKAIAGDYFSTLAHNLYCRHRNQYEKLSGEDSANALKKYGLQIGEDEFIYDHINRVDWREEKVISESRNYGGFNYNMGDSVSYNSMTKSVSIEKKGDFEVVDRGSLYITNRRIIFIGKERNENRTININDVLEFNVFKDGILIGKNYGPKPLIFFPEYIIRVGKAPNKRDHLNRIVRVLDRVFRRTQNQAIIE